MYGEHGDTGEQKLEKSETHMDKFERNNVRTVLFMHGNKEQTCFFYFGVVLSVMNRSVKENVKQIRHFRVPKNLTFKTRLGAKPLL